MLVSTQTITHEYLTLNGKVARETVKNNGSVTDVMDFIYDESGRAFALNYSTDGSSFTTYYYVLNLQGDVVKLVTSSGSIVAEYSYDAWGNLLVQSGSMADKNPLRYRGYYYDAETGFYYLQSRYYDPTLRRFLNADAYASTGQGFIGTNMFAYCGNNPASRSDASGSFWIDDVIESIIENAKSIIRSTLHAGNTLARSVGIDTAALGAPFLQMEKDENGIYHADFDCWQQYFGYNDLYDIAFDAATSMNSKKFPFSYAGEDYILWAWKGDYINLGAGAELGIYYGSEPHWSVDKSLALPMSLNLDYNGVSIISYSETTWWVTGFNPNYQNVREGCLTATYTVDFSSCKNMYYCFMMAYPRGSWTYNAAAYTATYIFK